MYAIRQVQRCMFLPLRIHGKNPSVHIYIKGSLVGAMMNAVHIFRVELMSHRFLFFHQLIGLRIAYLCGDALLALGFIRILLGPLWHLLKADHVETSSEAITFVKILPKQLTCGTRTTDFSIFKMPMEPSLHKELYSSPRILEILDRQELEILTSKLVQLSAFISVKTFGT